MRRIVTENGPEGRSRLLLAEEVQPFQKIWESDVSAWLGNDPAKHLDRHPGEGRDPASSLSEDGDTLDFRPGSLSARLIEIPPDTVMAEYLAQGVPGLDAKGFHRTGTLDYVILLEGRLVLELDDGKVEVRPGDVVVQRDTNHAWRNPEESPARCLCIIACPVETAA